MQDELVDDVFEDNGLFNLKQYHQNTDTGLSLNEANCFTNETPSPIDTVHPGFRQRSVGETDTDDGWRSYKIDDENKFDDSVVHKVKFCFPKLILACSAV